MSNKLHTLKEKIFHFLRFLTADIWRVDTQKEKGIRKAVNNVFRILILAGRGFSNNKLVMVASGLTYFTLLAAVPILCILLAVAKVGRAGSTIIKTAVVGMEKHIGGKFVVVP